jgi:hypothetical protein
MKQLIIIVSLAASLFAQGIQKNPTLNVFGAIGAGFKTGGLHYRSNLEYNNGSLTKVEDNYFNYGQGFKIDVGTQYFMMENVALQASMGLSFGVPAFEIKDNNALLSSTSTYKRNMYAIKVQVVPHFEMLELLNMYTGVGAGFFWNTLNYEIIIDRGALGTVKEDGKFKSTPSLGFTGMLGANIPLSDFFTVFGEVGFEQVSFKWKKKVVESSTITPTTVGTTFYEDDDPKNNARTKVPGSNWSIKAGLRFNLL